MRRTILIFSFISIYPAHQLAYGQLEYSGHSESADGFTSTHTYRSDLNSDGSKEQIDLVDYCSGCACPEIKIGSQVFEIPRDCYPVELVEGPNNSIAIVRKVKSKIVGTIRFESKKNLYVADW